MKYMLIIYGNEAADMARPQAEQEAEMERYFAFTNEAAHAGAMKGGEALHPTSTATTVRVRNGQVLTTDGPFAEAKEQLGGFYLLECKNLDEAIPWAAKIPHAELSGIEIRPCVDFSQAMPATAQ